MYSFDKQNEIPISYCECCHGEIYSGDTVYNLCQVYVSGRCIVHEDCLLDSLEQNKELVTQFLFGDLCMLQDIFNEILDKVTAWDIFDEWGDDEYEE